MPRNITKTSMKLRQSWLRALGGLEGVSVKNKEWLSLLEEDTRQSLMIEGYFVDKRELKEIIQNKRGLDDRAYKVLGYFDAAVFSYEFAFQQYQTGEFQLTKSLVRQIHALMFRNVPNFQYTPGEFRRGPIKITGAKVEPPEFGRVDAEIDRLIEAVNQSDADPIRKAVLAHAVFEQIHPFPDGNGRTGRILMNFILVAHGFPNVAIKGELESERNEYIKSLEEVDDSVAAVLKKQKTYKDLFHKPFTALEDLINETLAVALDTVICGRFPMKTNNELLPIDEVAQITEKNINSFRVACSQKKVICTKVGRLLMTHPLLLNSPKGV